MKRRVGALKVTAKTGEKESREAQASVRKAKDIADFEREVYLCATSAASLEVSRSEGRRELTCSPIQGMLVESPGRATRYENS